MLTIRRYSSCSLVILLFKTKPWGIYGMSVVQMNHCGAYWRTTYIKYHETLNDVYLFIYLFIFSNTGKPDAPIKLEAKDVIQPTVPVTVNITFNWIPGYSGGFPVDYILLYKEKNEQSFREQFLRAPEGNKYIFTYRKVATKYVFSIRAKNQKGSSPELTPYLEYTTRCKLHFFVDLITSSFREIGCLALAENVYPPTNNWANF